MAGRSALIVGATGSVGRHVLQELLRNKEFGRVAEYGRRVTALTDLPPQNPPNKLFQKTINFENIASEGLQDGKFDVVIISLGTNRAAAGSPENWVKIDREYVLAAAAAARVSGLKQRILYVSGTVANSQSRFLYVKSKGLTEEGLAKLGYDDVIVFRPAHLKNRANPKVVEQIASAVTGVLSYISPNLEVETSDVAKSILFAALSGSAALPPSASAFTAGGTGDIPSYTVIPNKGQNELAKLV